MNIKVIFSPKFFASYINRRCYIVVPGGTLSQEGDGPHKTEACIFNTPDEINMEIMKSWEQVFIKLMRRYKYLEKIFQVRLFYLHSLIAKKFGYIKLVEIFCSQSVICIHSNDDKNSGINIRYFCI